MKEQRTKQILICLAANPNHAFSKWACESGYLFLSVIEVFRPALSDNLHLFLT